MQASLQAQQAAAAASSASSLFDQHLLEMQRRFVTSQASMGGVVPTSSNVSSIVSSANGG